MELKQKEFIKYKLGLCLQSLLDKNSEASNLEGSHSNITSIRGLAAASELEYSIVQKITSGKKNPEFTTLVAIAEGLDIKLSELILKFESITDAEVLRYRELLKERANKGKSPEKRNSVKTKKANLKKTITRKSSQK